MAATLKLAWRNLWRSRRRTLISLSAVGLGLALVICYSGVVGGLVSEAKDQLDSSGLGHVELSATGWRSRRALKATLGEPGALLARLELGPTAQVSFRVLSRGLVSSARGTQAVEVHGVDWESEQAVAGYLHTLRGGALPATDDSKGVLVGELLAERLKVKVGSKLRLMVQRADGEMGAELLRVRGVFHSLSPNLSQRRVLVGRGALQELLGLPGAAHQVVIQLDRAIDAQPLADRLRPTLGEGLEVLTYADLFPLFRTMESLVDSAVAVGGLFVYFLAGLGILNTMLMSVLERTREFGVMQAIGTRPSGVLALVLAESFWIASLSVALGLALGLGLTWYGSTHVLLDYSGAMGEGLDLGGAVMKTAFKTRFSLADGFWAALYVYLMALVVGLYPAWRVSRLRPVEAMRAK